MDLRTTYERVMIRVGETVGTQVLLSQVGGWGPHACIATDTHALEALQVYCAHA